MPPQPNNPQPAYDDVDSMLSRKFGKEVANYFSGNPLNRVGFLREDNKFLSQALKHPSTSFLVCNELQPLIKKERKVGGHLSFLKYDDVKSIIGDDPWERSEEEVLQQYNSEKYVPQMIFLGIDEKNKDGLTYQSKNKYTGAPYFAVDITPKKSVTEQCERLIARLKDEGYDFATGRVMDVDASHGKKQQTLNRCPAGTIQRDLIG